MGDAISLKNAGNALYASQDYIQAYEKFTSAIELDSKNAILFSNRAACELAMNRQATFDAQMAVKLDPKYAKGWSGLAKCRDDAANYIGAVVAWRKAVECIPTTNLSRAEMTLNRQFKQGLRSTESRWKAARMATQVHKSLSQEVLNSGDLPWDRVTAMMQELCNRPETGISSASSSIMSALQFILCTDSGMDNVCLTYKTQVIEKLSDAVLFDKRIFHVAESSWMENYDSQCVFRNRIFKAWLDRGPEQVIELAKLRVLQKGWNNARPALSVTIRAWVMWGFFACRITHDYAAAVTWYDKAIELLDRGRRVWKDIPNEVRSMVFTDTFLRAVRSAHLEAYHDACTAELGKFDKKYPLRRLLELADELYLDASKPPPPNINRAWNLAFFRYPAANALAVKGWYHKHIGEEADCTPELRVFHNMKSAEMYIRAAREWIPQDDELHCWYLNAALRRMWYARAPLSFSLPVMAEIRKVYPDMNSIWEFSTALKGRDETLREVVGFERKVLRALQEGRLNMGSSVILGDKLD
ncbi:hypothetical protein BD410DRAFT_730338 [Rickenella mellea]|uniref:Uncharacterized protein n=1 Tax=Rickenella mellea TaxID=50990 RepID=A0A4Y7PQB1_9AGAM|nr:hypothetical protein BD410DRAFT_730338 [Rickenella mellea]